MSKHIHKWVFRRTWDDSSFQVYERYYCEKCLEQKTIEVNDKGDNL